ncbi:MAG: YHS domain-containing protein [Patescibacteria group bacterium]|nr:YHS domain-containing protein [Patescibacteria group bacterium]
MFNIFKNDDKARDPVCGMSVDKGKTQFSYINKEETFYFCSQNCKGIFMGDTKKQAEEKKGGCC